MTQSTDKANGQTLNDPAARVYELLDEWDAKGRDPGTAVGGLTMLTGLVASLPPGSLDFRRRRSILRAMTYGQRSRSGNFEIKQAFGVYKAATELGLMREGAQLRDARDVTTGRPVLTRLREIARLKYDWESETDRQWLKESWPSITTMPLVELKAWVRSRNDDSRPDLTPPDLRDVLLQALDRYAARYGIDRERDREAVRDVGRLLDEIASLCEEEES
jgi:hypothetical protein